MNLDSLQPLSGKIPPYPLQSDDLTQQAIQKFASDNGYEFYSKKPELVQYNWRDYKKLPSHLGMVGPTASKDAYNVIQGNYMGYPFTMYLMWDNIINGKYYSRYSRATEDQKIEYIKQQTTGVIRLALPKVFPQIVLDSNKNDDGAWSSIRTEFSQSQKLQLEGDFSQYFDLYIPSGLQINALSVLAPNMMQILKNHSGLFDVEFFGNEMILMTRHSLYDPANMKLLEEALKEQLAYMTRLMNSWNYMPINNPFDLLERPSIGGNTIKIGNLRLTAKMQLIAICAFFLLFSFIIMWLN